MRDANRNFWPLQPRFSLLAAAALLIVLLVSIAILRRVAGWPGPQSDNFVLIGIAGLSLLPVVLALVDIIISMGATVEIKGVKVDFSHGQGPVEVGITIPPNFGTSGQALTDSGTIEILETLRQATNNDVVVLDLEDGQAWWETRLLVLLAGASRLGAPDKIVFVGKDANTDYQFQGWSYTKSLFPLLLAAHPQYGRSVQSALAASKQWELVEPLDAPSPSVASVLPAPAPSWLASRLAPNHRQFMAFDTRTGLHNEFFAEQLLQDDLGQKIEMQEGARRISLVRLEELFRSALYKESIDLNWAEDRQLETFLVTQSPFVALTRAGRYSALARRETLIQQVLISLIKAKGTPGQNDSRGGG